MFQNQQNQQNQEFVVSNKTLVKLIERLPIVMTNDYIVGRHLQAETNINGILHSDPTLDSLKRSGVTENGYKALPQMLSSLINTLDKDKEVVILTSTLIRASTPGQRIYKALSESGYSVELEHRTELIDRCWGRAEGAPVDKWSELLNADLGNDLNPVSNLFRGAESQEAFFIRLVDFVLDCEKRFDGKQVIMITHCDALQVLESILLRDVRGHYSQHTEFACAQIKKILLP